MKANELTIGDLVDAGTRILLEDGNFIIGASKVVELRRDYLVIECSEHNAELKIHDYADVRPIPITPEILEKSGFKLQPTAHYYWGDEFVDIDIEEFTDGLWEVVVWNVEVDMLDCKIYISYVHELQHVLELCGIDRLEVVV